jgi:hypothetical protein
MAVPAHPSPTRWARAREGQRWPLDWGICADYDQAVRGIEALAQDSRTAAV